MSRTQRWLALVVVTMVSWGIYSFGTEIHMKNGMVYHDVKILTVDATNMVVEFSYGVLNIPLNAIEATGEVTKAAVAMAVEKPGPPAELPPAPYVHNWKMDYYLAGATVLILGWISMLLWVQRDAHGTPAEIKRANADVLLLPGLGLALYLVARSRRLKAGEERRTLSGRVAGLHPDEAPKKRGLFGNRTKIMAVLRPKKHRVDMEFLDANHNPIQVKKDMPEMTGIEAAREVLKDAISERASDVHLEPHDNGCRVRFRIDGVLQERMVFEKTDGLRVSAALKTLAQIDVAERRKAQDGRFRVRTEGGEIDFRVATANSIHGEKLVLRILDRNSGLLSLGDLGMPQEMMETFDRVIHSRNGMILATGPTGSGKTSTLYAALSRLDAKRLNLMSIEDPVEYELSGATQMAVNVKAGVTYEAGLRSILRQDPDVIFVGEMRDAEAAKIALRAALTGHLVFTTLHTKDAPGSIVRLEEMGIERYQISSALLMIVAQRLVRVLCPTCRKSYEATGKELLDLRIELPEGSLIYQAVGCDACDQTGYLGRTGLFELLVVEDELRQAITDGASHETLMEIAKRRGLHPYHEDGALKVLLGITSIDEVLQAS